MSEERQLERETELNESLAAKQIEQIRASVPQGRIGPAHCVECGDPIPEQRRWGGYDHCVSCARWNEEMDKRFGRML